MNFSRLKPISGVYLTLKPIFLFENICFSLPFLKQPTITDAPIGCI